MILTTGRRRDRRNSFSQLAHCALTQNATYCAKTEQRFDPYLDSERDDLSLRRAVRKALLLGSPPPQLPAGLNSARRIFCPLAPAWTVYAMHGHRFKQAHEKASQRREEASDKPRKMTPDLVELIEEKLTQGQWSPDQISGRLAKDGVAFISHELARLGHFGSYGTAWRSIFSVMSGPSIQAGCGSAMFTLRNRTWKNLVV